MISLGSLLLVVFMLQVKRRDRGLISPLSFTTLEIVLRPPGVKLFLSPSVSVPPSYRLLNLEDNFEKNEVRAAELRAEVSWEERGTPYWLVGGGLLVWPEWKVDLAGTWRWKAAAGPRPGPGETAFLRLALRPSVPIMLVLSVEELL